MKRYKVLHDLWCPFCGNMEPYWIEFDHLLADDSTVRCWTCGHFLKVRTELKVEVVE